MRRCGSTQGVDFALGDTELRERLGKTVFSDGHERRHSSRQAQQFEEVDATVERGGEGQRVLIDEEGDRRALLSGEEDLGLVVTLARIRASRDVDEGDRRAALHELLRDFELSIAAREIERRLLDRFELRARLVDRRPQRVVGKTAREMTDDDAE